MWSMSFTRLFFSGVMLGMGSTTKISLFECSESVAFLSSDLAKASRRVDHPLSMASSIEVVRRICLNQPLPIFSG